MSEQPQITHHICPGCGQTVGDMDVERLRRERDVTELKPCPFCGADESHATIFAGDYPDEEEGFPVGIPAYVRCQTCLSEGPHVAPGETRQAIAAWNRRAERG